MTKETEYKLLNCRSLAEFLTMFFGLGMKDKLSVFPLDVELKKDTYLYRIRRTNGISDPNNPKEWEPTPKDKAHQGRFNREGESVLYVGSDPEFLEREVRLNENEEYYLAKYVCKKTFSVGSFLGADNQVNTLIHKVAMSVFNSNDLTKRENQLIDKYYELVKNESLFELSTDMLASLFIYKMLPGLYSVTNRLGQLILRNNKNGIRYSSAFVPLELSGASEVITLDGVAFGNYVLSLEGYKNIDFVLAEKKVAKKATGLELMIETCAEERFGTIQFVNS